MAIFDCGGALPSSFCPSAGTVLRFVGQSRDIPVRGQLVHVFFIYGQPCTDVPEHRHHISETGFSVLVMTRNFHIRKWKLWWHLGFSSTLLPSPFLRCVKRVDPLLRFWSHCIAKAEKLGNTFGLLHQKLSNGKMVVSVNIYMWLILL